jgi:hypothetical protein
LVPPEVYFLDSAALITAQLRGAVVVTGSHGGRSAAHFALSHGPCFVVFNDAGGGLDDAGVSGLALLDEAGIAACTVAHTSARIGDARSTFTTGVVSHVNRTAQALGARVEMGCAQAVALVSALAKTMD